MIALFLAAGLAQACTPPDGVSQLWERSERIIVVGESHGTREGPAAFAEIVCAATEQGPVTVALELPSNMQPSLNAFLAAADATTALEALEGTPFLAPRMADGRTSESMLDMLNRIRTLRTEGRDVAIHAFQPNASRPRDWPQAWYELDMAANMAAAVYQRPTGRVLALVGNLHARNTAIERLPEVGLPAAAHLPAQDTLTVVIAQQGGEAWNCQEECGPHTQGARYDPDARGVILEPYAEGAYDAVLALGPSTASPPIQAQAPTVSD